MAYPNILASEVQAGQTLLPDAADWQEMCKELWDDVPAKRPVHVTSVAHTNSGQYNIVCSDFPDPKMASWNCPPTHRITLIPEESAETATA